MQTDRPKAFTYDIAKLEADMAEKGWLPTDLARVAEVADTTVHRFLSGEVQTPKTLKKLAGALGYGTKRYLVRRDRAA